MDPPRDLTAVNVQTDSATLKWRPPHAAVTGYMLSFSSADGTIRVRTRMCRFIVWKQMCKVFFNSPRKQKLSDWSKICFRKQIFKTVTCEIEGEKKESWSSDGHVINNVVKCISMKSFKELHVLPQESLKHEQSTGSRVNIKYCDLI